MWMSPLRGLRVLGVYSVGWHPRLDDVTVSRLSFRRADVVSVSWLLFPGAHALLPFHVLKLPFHVFKMPPDHG
jgi:hypothetical protein